MFHYHRTVYPFFLDPIVMQLQTILPIYSSDTLEETK